MKGYGVLMIVLGCMGLGLGHIMYGDIGIASTYTGIVAITTGIGFLKIDNKYTKNEEAN